MAGISPTSAAIAPGTGITAAPAASTATAGTPASGQLPGATVSTTTGSTTLPAAAPADFASSPTPLDQPDATYKSLLTSHVAFMRAAGAPEAVIGDFANRYPQAEELDLWLQGELMQNLEGWDQQWGNQPGTARAGLTQAFPGIQLPAPQQGTPGLTADGRNVSGINVPGVTTPTNGTLVPPGQEGKAMMGIVAAVVLGAGALIGYKVLKNKKAPQALAGAFGGAAGGAAGIGAGANGWLGRFGAGGGQELAGLAAFGGGGNVFARMGDAFGAHGVQAGDAGAIHKAVLFNALGAGHAGAQTGGAAGAAAADLIGRGLLPTDGRLAAIGNAALLYNTSFDTAAKHLKDLMLIESRQLGDYAAGVVAANQAFGQVGAAGMDAAQIANVRQALANAHGMLPT